MFDLSVSTPSNSFVSRSDHLSSRHFPSVCLLPSIAALWTTKKIERHKHIYKQRNVHQIRSKISSSCWMRAVNEALFSSAIDIPRLPCDKVRSSLSPCLSACDISCLRRTFGGGGGCCCGGDGETIHCDTRARKLRVCNSHS